MSRDPYKQLSREWGSKSKKAESRQKKAGLKRISLKDIIEAFENDLNRNEEEDDNELDH